MNLLELPDCMLEQIFEYLPYDEIARKRVINTKVNKICQRLLNRGFNKMIRRHTTNLKRIKSLLPRRESERRNHPMARHADILTCIETRISMLSMTYTKYMELNLCCFIPGKIIDEVLRILKLIESTTKPLRAFEVLQELRDLSSMAIEHFDDKIANFLKKSYVALSTQKFSVSSSSSSTSVSGNLCSTNNGNTSGVASLDDPVMIQNSSAHLSPVQAAHMQRSCGTIFRCNEAAMNRILIKKMEVKYKDAIKKFNRMIHIQNKQARQLRENAVAMSEMNAQIVELKRRIEIIKTNRNVEISGDPSTSTNKDNKNITSEVPKRIKPRTATLILKRRIVEKHVHPSSSDNISKKPKLE